MRTQNWEMTAMYCGGWVPLTWKTVDRLGCGGVAGPRGVLDEEEDALVAAACCLRTTYRQYDAS